MKTLSNLIRLSMLLLPIFSMGQLPGSFTLNGNTTMLAGKEVWVAPAIMDERYQADIPVQQLSIENGKFKLEGKISMSQPILFSYLLQTNEGNFGIQSELFFVDKDTSTVTLFDFRTSGSFDTAIMRGNNREYLLVKNAFKKEYRHLNFDGISPDEIANRQSFLLNYIGTNPSSTIALWVLIYDYTRFGYTEKIDQAVRLFNPSVAASAPCKTLMASMAIDAQLWKGKKFPFHLAGFGNQLASTAKKNKLTLVEFWAGYCKPCIEKFPGLKEVQMQYAPGNFEIVGISIDNEKGISTAREILSRYDVRWKTIFDKDGRESKKLNITGVPRNFLIDNQGTIVEINVSVDQLKALL